MKLKTANMTNQYLDNGEAIQTFVNYGNVELERVGGNYYLRAVGETYSLSMENISDLLNELDKAEINQPLTAATYIYQQRERFTKISK
jgi:hypothetical protein